MYVLNALLLSFFVTIHCESDRVLLKFKTDVDKVGQDFENLIFDVVRKIVDDVGVYQDYYSSDEVTTQHSVTKKILDDLENTTEEYNTEKTALKNSSQYGEILHNRLKRSAEENSSIPLDQSEEIKPITNTSATNDTSCIDDLKEEIKKLHDLVMLLRDQQKIISLLDKNAKHFDSDIAARFGARDVLKILDYVNNRDIQEQKDFRISDNSELSNLKKDLKEAIATLNKTRHVLTMERKKELLLEKELSDQKLDISFLKMMVEKLYKNNMQVPRDDILGAAHQHSPKDLPNHSLVKAILGPGGAKRISAIEEPRLRTENSGRSSGLDDLEMLVRKLNQPKKPDIESRILDLQHELDKKKQEEDVLAQVKVLEKYLEHRKKQQGINSESELIRRLQHAMKATDDGENRALDDEIEQELQKLQEAINNLRPNDDIDSADQSDGDMKRFQSVLKKFFFQQNRRKDDEAKRFQMYDGEGKREEDPVKEFQVMLDRMANQGAKDSTAGPVNKEQNLLLREIIELRKQLAGSGKSQFGGGYNFGYPDAYGQTKYPPEEFKNDRPYYPPYMNPGYQNMRSQNFNSGDQHFANQIQSSDYPKPISPNFLPTYFKSVPQEYKKIYDGTSNQFNFEQNPYQTPTVPNKFNMGPSLEQNRYQNPPDFPMSAYRYNPDANTDFQPLAELHEIPFTISVLPTHKALNMETNSIDIPYGKDQNPFHQDRNQFFPASHTKSTSKLFHPPRVPPGSGAGQPGTYPPETAENVGRTYQNGEDLKAQIYNLHSIIDDLNKPNHTQTLQDKETVAGLEKQIDDLKGVIDSMNPGSSPNFAPISPSSDQGHHLSEFPGKTRRKKSIINSDASDENSKLYDQVASGLKKLIFDEENKIRERSSYDDLQNRINDLRYQLESVTHSREGPILNTKLNTYQLPYYQHNSFYYSPPKVRPFEMTATVSKKDDVFTELVINILDKLIASTPAILERLFGHGLTELSNFEGYLNSNVGQGGQNDVQKLLTSLGFFGYGPLIFLRLVDGFTTFVSILRKNEFFKNFLTPAFIVLLVAGAVVFLVWWLQPNVDSKPQPSSYYDKYNEPYSNYNYLSKGYGNNSNNYGYRGSYRPPVYSGNYLEEGRQRGKFNVRISSR